MSALATSGLSDAALTRIYLDAAHQVEERTGGTVRDAVLALVGVDDETALAYSVLHARLVSAGQLSIMRLADAYCGGIFGAVLDAKTHLETAKAVKNVLVTPSTPSATSPVIRIRFLLSEGHAWEDALEQAATYANGLAITDVQAAQIGRAHVFTR